MLSRAAQDLVNGVLSGSAQAAGRLISLLENDGEQAAAALQALFPHTGSAYVVGVTGPPGSGKSTLVNTAIRRLRGRGQRVGVVAVDPTSPFSGGALLGDRVRMQDHATDPEVFVRSMATRGSLGGLAPAADEAVAVLAAWGARVVFLETVGTGQAEVDVVSAADTVVVVTAPGLGDGIQTIKAGVMEIADVFVVNKADRPDADRTVTELKMAVGAIPEGRWRPPVLTTVATTGEGAEDLLRAVDEHRAFQERAGALAARRRLRWRRDILRLAEARLRARLLDGEAGARLEALADEVAAGRLDPRGAADRLLRPVDRDTRPAGVGAAAPEPERAAPAADLVRAAPAVERVRAEPAVPAPPGGVHLDHIGIAVRNLDGAGRFYAKVLGLRPSPPELLLDDSLAAAFVTVGGTRIELLEPATIDGPVARFLERRGEGVHHLAIAVGDLERALARAREAGYALVDETPRAGAHGTRIAFLHPRDTHGVLIELVERGDG